MNMKILIDADGCPVVGLTVNIAIKESINVIIISDTSHIFDYNFDNIKVINVSKGQDSTDFSLLSKAEKNDIVITQDYALASMCFSKGCYPINQNGFLYTNEIIENLLFRRYISKKIRNSGKKVGRIGKIGKTKKRNKNDNERFKVNLINLINMIRSTSHSLNGVGM